MPRASITITQPRVFSAPGFGLQRKGRTPVDSSIWVDVDGNRIILRKGRYTSTEGVHYILPNNITIDIQPDDHFAKIVSVALVEGRNRVFIWVDENRYVPTCLHVLSPMSELGVQPSVEIHRFIVDDEFQLPRDFRLVQYFIGRLWAVMCPRIAVRDYFNAVRSELCNACPIGHARGRFGGTKVFAFSWVNCLTPVMKVRYWEDPVRGLQSYPFSFYDEHGVEVVEIPHFAIRADEITDRLIYNPKEMRFEDKPKKELPEEVMLKKAEKPIDGPEYEISGVVRTYGRPAIPPSRYFVDKIIEFLRSKFPDFDLPTITESRLQYEREIARRMKEFLEQVETLPPKSA